ncbi:MAG: hypothetical protein WBF55_21490 [Syntrophobacteria bacterium]
MRPFKIKCEKRRDGLRISRLEYDVKGAQFVAAAVEVPFNDVRRAMSDPQVIGKLKLVRDGG